MEKAQLIQEINELKKEKKAVILAHNYQLPEIQDIADYLGDSLELAKISKKLDYEVIVFCGVKFMAETAKILSPEKKVLLPVLGAGCPLADKINRDQLLDFKSKYRDAKVVSYVNTSAEVKAESDVCCTSSNAVEVVKNLGSGKILFVPDKNLGRWVRVNLPLTDLVVWEGFCYVHEAFTLGDIQRTKNLYPNAEVLVHPECPPEIQDASTFVTSTSGMLKRAKESDCKEFIIGTEKDMLYRLKKENPGKEFYFLGKAQCCDDMKKTDLQALHDSLAEDKNQINLSSELMDKARKALEGMVKYT